MATTRTFTQPVEAPQVKQGLPLGLKLLTGAALLLIGAAAVMVFTYAPTEAVMGNVQRIFYFHVAAAWAGALAFMVTVGTGITYLITRDLKWDRIAYSSVEVGLALITAALAGGMVWGQAVWGTAWTWDPKLTSFAVMWLSYAAYLMLRQGIEDPDRRARFAAVYGIVAFASVVFTYAGVRAIEETLHPHVIGESAGTAEDDFGLSQRMSQTLMFSVFAFTVGYAALLWHRVRIQKLNDYVEQLKMRVFIKQMEG